MSRVTIQTGLLRNYQVDDPAPRLRGYASETFTTSDSVVILGSRVGNEDVYIDVVCSVNGDGDVVYPEFLIDSTTDSLDNPNAAITFALEDSQGGLIARVYEDLRIPPAPSPTSLAALEVYTNGAASVTVTDMDQVNSLIATQIAAATPDASTAAKGLTKLSSAPVLANSPIAVGDNDSRIVPMTGIATPPQPRVVIWDRVNQRFGLARLGSRIQFVNGALVATADPPTVSTTALYERWKMSSLSAHSDGDAIASWTGVNGKSFVQATGANKPLYKLASNGRPTGLLFDGANDYMTVDFGEVIGQPLTIYIVCSTSALAAAGVILDGIGGTARVQVYFDGAHIEINGGAALDSLAQTLPFGICVIAAVFNGANSSVFKDGVEGTTGNAGTQSIGGLTLGAYYGFGANFDGFIYDVCVFQAGHGAGEKARNLAGLRQEYMGEVKPRVICFGNSLTFGYDPLNPPVPIASPYPTQLAAMLGSDVDVLSYGYTGKRVDQLITIYDSDIAPLYRGTASDNILSFEGLYNDLQQGQSAADVISDLTTLFLKARTTGYSISVFSPPRADYTGGQPADYAAKAATVHDFFINEALPGHLIDKYVDLTADPHLGVAASTLDTAYFSGDRLHLVAGGYTIYATGQAAKVAQILAS